MERINILHDFDNPHISGKYALRRGVKLIIYAVSKKFPLLRRFAKDIYTETYYNCKTLAILDRLLGVRSAFGLKDEVLQAFPSLRSELSAMGFPVHRHYHISTEDVRWDPPLDVEKEAWFFDQEFSKNTTIKKGLKWAVFHADYPQLLSAYVNFLSQAKAMDKL
jgi:hypothetical protein